MVRRYVRKTQRGSQYSQEDLKHCVNEIKKGTLTIHRAHKMNNIPKTTLFYHLKGLRGNKSESQGRAPSIPKEDERRLANGLRIMEKWGFGITRKELLLIVSEYVQENKLKTPFKNNIPGDEWFKNFKLRHKLSIKKPQSVEYARKKMTDPFVINEHFDLLESTLKELSLQNKPQNIWNLDESSFCHDPSKTKILGDRGKPSSRTVASPGRENTTVLSAVSASGLKAPPLIVYKGKNIWDAWIPAEEDSFEGMSFAASKNGWMESDIFFNYFKKTLLTALGPERPTLIVFDGHSTHITIPLIEFAMANDITILKLPPHTSHLLQPLDLTVFRPMKVTWDEKLVAWQRRNIGLKMPKKHFSEMIGQTWKNLNPSTIINGFKKAGIHPFDRTVVSEDKYDPECLKRWMKHKYLQEQPVSPIIVRDQTEKQPDCLNIIQDQTEQPTVTSPQPSTSKQEVSFEDLLLKKVRFSGHEQPKIRRKKVATGAEIITSVEVLTRLEDEKKKTEEKTDKKAIKKNVKRNCRIPEEIDDTTDEEITEVPLIDSDDDMDPESPEHEQEEVIDEPDVGKWVIVKYLYNKKIRHFVGNILSKADDGWEIKFLKGYKQNFIWPEIDDIDIVIQENIVQYLPNPKRGRRGNTFIFSVDFTGFNIMF